MKYEIVSTGSKGNCVIMCDGEVMVDCGVSYNRIKSNLYDVKYLILTHIHTDHVRASTLQYIKKDFPKITIIGNHEVHQIFGVDIIANATFPIVVDGYTFTPFELVHDVLCYGYTFEYQGQNIIYATDTSSMKNAPDEKFDYIFIESNHDEKKVEKILENRNQFGYDAYSGAKRHLSTQEAKKFYYFYRRNKESKFIELHQSSRFY